MKNVLLAPVLCVFFLLGCAQAPIDIEAHRRAEKQSFMISAAHPLAAQAGYDVLAKGGSAVDAAIATEMVLTLVEPQSSGIGGGAFIVHYDRKTGAISTFDGRETAPASAHADMFLKADGKPLKWREAAGSGRSIGIPGVVRMLGLAHARHGRLPWRELIAPAIRLADNGFVVTPRLAGLLKSDNELPIEPSLQPYFYPGGEPLKAGDILRNPALATTLRRIADNGPDGFYMGDVPAQIAKTAATMPRLPATITQDDFAAYRAKQRLPVCARYRTYKVCGMGPPSSGGVLVAQILGILEHFDLAALPPFSAEAVHLIVEASRLAFADRARYLGDADFVDVPVKWLTDPGYLASRAALISPTKRMPAVSAGTTGRVASAPFTLPEEKGTSTTHFSIVDASGNAVSMTASIERAFGAKTMAAGFLLNNQLTDFSYRTEGDHGPAANAIAPGKRPRSTMSPTLVFDDAGALKMVIGSPGGSRIAGYTLQTIIAVLDWNMDIADAVAAPHIVSRGGPVDLEKGTTAEALAPALEALGHEVKIRPMTSGLHGIVFDGDKMVGGADPRREGVVLGR